MRLPRHDTGGHPGNLTRGHWDSYTDIGNRKTAAVACPTCDHLFTVRDHAIGPDGTCVPSVVCPWKGCTFHVTLTLDGWSP